MDAFSQSWPDALKREIVEATIEPGASVSIVARRFDVNANQVFQLAQAFSRRSAFFGRCAGASTRNLPTCSTGSIGAIRLTVSGPSAQDNAQASSFLHLNEKDLWFHVFMDSRPGTLANDIEALKAALVAQTAWAAQSEAELAVAKAKISDDQALIARQQLHIEKPTRELHGSRSERTSRILDQAELQFEEMRREGFGIEEQGPRIIRYFGLASGSS